MTTLNVPNTLSNGSTADASDVQQNFDAIESHVNTELVNRDGSIAMTGELLLSGDPSSANGATRKAWVESQIGSQFMPVINAPIENWNIVAAAASGTINVDVKTSAVWFYTSNASANWTLNFRGDVSTTLDSLVSTGDTITVGFVSVNGSTAYKPSAVQVDGVARTVKWQGAYSSGRANATDIWLFTLVNTSTGNWQVFGSVGSYL